MVIMDFSKSKLNNNKLELEAQTLYPLVRRSRVGFSLSSVDMYFYYKSNCLLCVLVEANLHPKWRQSQQRTRHKVSWVEL